MSRLSALERAVLFAIARQVGGVLALDLQLTHTQVVSRKNTGVGFYTAFQVTSGPPFAGAASRMGDVGAKVKGLEHGMGFLVWLQAGRLDQLEGYTYGESTTGLDFEHIAFSDVAPRA